MTKRVLIVDDKEENLYYLQALLGSQGCVVDTARHGAEALVKARQAGPDLVISDLLMPVMDGFTLLRHWKLDPRLAQVPFVVYTATYTEAEDERLALSLGADAFILKPAEPDAFLARLAEVRARVATTPPVQPQLSARDEQAILKVYSETLIRKLEEKTLQLGEANRNLEEDIANRKATERSLRESEQRFRELAENINEVFWVSSPGKQEILYVSPAYERIWGRPAASLYAAPASWREAIHAEDRERVAQAAATKQVAGTYDETYRILRPDGSLRWVHDRAYPVRNDRGELYRIVGTAEDITERKALEEQFFRAQRMESIGTLAGGIAHDMNNLLTPIVMGVGLLKVLEPDPAARQVIESIEKSARRGTELVKQVLSFARGVTGARVAVPLAEIAREIEAIIGNTFPKSITFQLELAPGLWPARGDPTQINQILLNLCLNARDAMPEGGRLTLTARNTEVDAQYATMLRTIAPGRYVQLEVRDTGRGMSKEVMDRIFEPFYTTKGPGQGTGLGLSTVLGIVRSHGGSVVVESEVGHGSVFKVLLPVPDEETSRAAASAATAPAPRGRGEKILLVDDDSSVLDITSRTLTAHGYEVVTAGDGAQAMGLYALRQSDIALVVTDIMMPVMDGSAFVTALRRINPRVPVLAVSGLGAQASLNRIQQNAGVGQILAKPYTAEELLTVVGRMIGGRGSRSPFGATGP